MTLAASPDGAHGVAGIVRATGQGVNWHTSVGRVAASFSRQRAGLAAVTAAQSATGPNQLRASATSAIRVVKIRAISQYLHGSSCRRRAEPARRVKKLPARKTLTGAARDLPRNQGAAKRIEAARAKAGHGRQDLGRTYKAASGDDPYRLQGRAHDRRAAAGRAAGDFQVAGHPSG
jgi:hypothetical protein